MLQEYLVTLFGKNTNRTVKIGYRDGLLVSHSIPESEDYDDKATSFLHNWLRSQVEETKMLENVHDATLLVRFRADKMEVDTGFDAFWNAYNYKVGNKKKAMTEWEKLPQEDRVRCLRSLPRYEIWLKQKTKQEKIYPERYLSQSRWENEYKV